MAIVGNSQPPERDAYVDGPGVWMVVPGVLKAPFGQKSKAWALMGTTTSASAVSASLMADSGSRNQTRSSLLDSGGSAASVALATGIRINPLSGGVLQLGLNACAICAHVPLARDIVPSPAMSTSSV